MGTFIEQLAGLWRRLELPQRVTLVLVALGLAAIAVLVVVGVRTPDYRVLAKGLAQGQVAEIAAYLDSQRVPYRVVDNQSTILVPSAQLYTLRNTLAEQEMLTDGSRGFEILAESGFGQSSFREQKTYDRAVAGELERSFRELPSVRNARVIINRPPPSPFLVDERSASAAIKLEMHSGRRLSDRQLAGVVHLAAGAVEGLAPDRVQVVDGSGLLTRAEEDSGVGVASTRLEAARAKELYLTQKAQSMLDSVLGPGRSLVQVAVDLDFTRRSEAESSPTGIQPLRIVSSTQDERTPVPLDAGVAGTLPNVEGEGAASESHVFGTRSTESETRENVVGKRQTSVEHETGRVRGMTVSILLDEKSEWVEEPAADGQGPATRREERRAYDAAERERFRDMVLAAIGYHAARGAELERVADAAVDDRFNVSIQSMAMHRDEPLPEVVPGAQELLAEWSDALRYAVAAMVALVLLLVARGQLRRSQAVIDSEAIRRRRAEEEAAKLEADKARMTGVASVEMEKRSELRDQVRREVESDPDSAATVLKAWIHDGR